MDFRTNNKRDLGETVSVQAKAVMREAARDFAVVAPFGFWAVMIGFVPVLAIHTLFG